MHPQLPGRPLKRAAILYHGTLSSPERFWATTSDSSGTLAGSLRTFSANCIVPISVPYFSYTSESREFVLLLGPLRPLCRPARTTKGGGDARRVETGRFRCDDCRGWGRMRSIWEGQRMQWLRMPLADRLVVGSYIRQRGHARGDSCHGIAIRCRNKQRRTDQQLFLVRI